MLEYFYMEKVIVVTGGAQGIGRAIVERLLLSKAVVLHVLDKQKTDFIAATLALEPTRFYFYEQDIADDRGLAHVLKELAQYKIAGIVNNAGEVYFEDWSELQMATWDRTMAVNARAPLAIVHALRDALQFGASIVNISSTDRERAGFTTLPYAASKAALSSITMSLAAILGEKQVRVNAVAPGWVVTEMTKDTMPNEAAWITPLGRNAEAEEIASVVTFLLSEESRFITGQTITVDGGMSVVDYTIKSEAQNT